MRISSATITTAVEHALTRAVTRSESLRAWVDGAGGAATATVPHEEPLSRIAAAGNARLLSGACAPCGGAPASSRETRGRGAGDLIAPDLPVDERARVLLLDALLKAFFGREVAVRVERIAGRQDTADARAVRVEEAAPEQTGQTRHGWGLEYDCQVSSEESETLRFAARGVVRTADGREVPFNAELELSRAFLAQAGVSLRAGDARFSDPLVINYAGPAADLAGGRLAFDVDVDGTLEEIPVVKAGSGFLAIDLDGDGVVGDGGELFGPTTGDAFAELAAYDVDGNGWIDAGDPAYGRLRIWIPSAGGASSQLTLGEVGIGAISVNGIEAPFGVRDRGNQPLGQNKRVGVFVREDGLAGTTQQIDLAV